MGHERTQAPLCVLHVMEATIGGTRRHLIDVARWQRRAGARVIVVAACEREPRMRADLAALEGEGVEAIEIPMVRSIAPLTDWRHLRRIERLLCELRPDVVHTHSSKAGVLGRCAALETGIGLTVHTPHTFAFLFEAMFGSLKRALFRRIEEALSQSTSAIVAVSEGEAQTMRASGVVPADRVHVVHNGIEVEPWLDARPLSRGELGLSAEGPLVGVFGLLNVAKGQDLALRALNEPGLERATLLVVGHGAERESLEDLVRELRIAERVRFLGWRDDVPAILAACDVVCLPSRWEGLPYILLEAMAAAKPVVATRVDGARELVVEGVTGATCELESPRDLARALSSVLALEPGARRELGERGRARVLGRYTVQRMARGLLDLYQGLA